MASKSLGTLTIDLIAKTGGFEQGMDRAGRAAERGSREIEKRLQRIDRGFDKIRIGVATTGIAIAGAVGAWVNSITKSMDATLKMARQIGTTTEALTGLRYAAQQFSNVSDQTFDMSLRRMTRRIAEAAEGSGAAKKALEGLGVSAKELAGLSVEEQFYRVADAIKGTADQGSRLRATMAIFDTEGVPLVNALSQGRGELQKYTEEARRLGVVIDTDVALAAERFQTSLGKMRTSLNGVSISLGNQVLPVLSQFIENAIDAATEVDGIKNASDALARDIALPDWIDTVGQGLAIVADVAVGLGRTLHTVTLSFQAVAADVRKALASIAQDQTGLSDIFAPEEAERRRAEYEAIVNERNDIVARANAALENLWNYDGDRFLQAWIDARDQVRQQADQIASSIPTQQLPPISVRGSGSSTKDRTTELQALIKQLDLERATLGMTEAAAGRYRIEVAKGTETDRARALALYDQIQAWKEAKAAIDQAAESSRYIAAINRELEVFQQRQDIEIAGVGMGDRQREEMERELAVRQEYAERRRQLEEAQQVESTKLTEEQYQRRLAALDDAEKRQIEILRDAAQRKLEAESIWLNGVTAGLQNYVDEANNAAASVRDSVQSAFKGMEDSLANFVQTGKLNFSDLVNSIVADLARIAVKQSITGPLASAFANLFGGLASSPFGAIDTGGWFQYANGGVFGGASLSRYSNRVYNTPQVFEFAKGVGIFAEAGPEAIMPLSRGPDGKLGVRADLSGVGPSTAAPQVNIINQTSQPIQTADANVRHDGERWVVDVVLKDLKANGPIRRQLAAL